MTAIHPAKKTRVLDTLKTIIYSKENLKNHTGYYFIFIFLHNNKSKSERLNKTTIFAHTIMYLTLVEMLTYFIPLCISNFVMEQLNLRSLRTLL